MESPVPGYHQQMLIILNYPCPVEGLITIFAGLIFLAFVPPAVGNGKPLISFGRWSYFTEREVHIIRNRVILDDHQKAQKHIRISGADILNTFRQKRIWLHVFITLVPMTAVQGLTTYTPTIIKSEGFSTVKANALASVPIFCSIAMLIITAVIWFVCILIFETKESTRLTLYFFFSSDWTGHRGPAMLFICTWSLIADVCLRTLPYTVSVWHRYAAVVMALMMYANIQ